MRKTPHALATSESRAIARIDHLIAGWLLDGEIRAFTSATLAARRLVTDKFLWFLHQKEFAQVGAHEVRAFLACVTRGHEASGGGGGTHTGPSPQALRPSAPYYRNLKTFFRWR